jgi:uncharacterized membrane protein
MKKIIKHKKPIIVLTIIILIGLILRILNLFSPFSHDEWYTYDIVARNITSMNSQMYPDVHVPLYFYLVKVFTAFVGLNEFNLRIFSVILGFLGIVAMAIFTVKFFGVKNAIISTGILSFSVFHVAYSQVARMYSLLFLAIVCSLYFLFELIFKEKKYSLGGYIGSNLIIIYTHFFGIFFILFETISLIIYKNRIRDKRRIIFGHLIMFILMIPFVIFMIIQVYRKIIGTSYANWMSNTTILDIYLAFSAMSSNHILTIPFLLLFIYFLYNQIKKFRCIEEHNIKKNIVLIGLVVGLILPAIITLITPIYAWRYFTIIYPLSILMIVFSIQDIKFNNKKLIYSVVFTLLILSSIMLSFKLNIDRQEENICLAKTIEALERYKTNNTYITTYRWLNEWVPDHDPITGALNRKQEILKTNMSLLNYHNNSLDYIFQDYENLMLVSRSYLAELYVNLENLTPIENNSCLGYHYFVYIKKQPIDK